jgi:hypothetical protein
MNVDSKTSMVSLAVPEAQVLYHITVIDMLIYMLITTLKVWRLFQLLLEFLFNILIKKHIYYYKYFLLNILVIIST